MKKILLFILFIMCLTGCGKNCPKGYDLEGDICKKEIDKVDPYSDYTCPSGYELKGEYCIKYAQIEIK